MAGWIKLSREIKDHWIFADPVKFKWWIDILLTVNFEDKKVPFGFKILECKRGEALMSLQNWAKKWGVTKSVVKNFFTMLESDGMITHKNETVTTRITVCNYDSYQQLEYANNTQGKRNTNATQTQHGTTKEREERKEGKEEIKDNDIFSFKKSLISLGVETQIAEDWMKVRKLKKASNTKTSFEKIKTQIELSEKPANECIKIAVEKDWKGFEAEWLKNIIQFDKQKPNMYLGTQQDYSTKF
jgi:hypothetical protein